MIVCSQVRKRWFNTLKTCTLSQSPGNGDVFFRGLLKRGMIPPGNGDVFSWKRGCFFLETGMISPVKRDDC
jgi:hypothetical protein